MTDAAASERARLRFVYDRRDEAMPPDDWRRNPYHPRHPVGGLFQADNRAELVRALNTADVDLRSVRALDVGCGRGGWLRSLLDMGAPAGALHGLDASDRRLADARASNPAIRWIAGDAVALPFADAGFDLVLQVLLFSSVLDPRLHERMAAEMLRVTRGRGLVLWLDLSRGDPGRLVGFSRRAVARLFPGAELLSWRPAHPRYFRSLGRVAPAFAAALSHVLRRPNESWLALLRKGGP